jgi:hypothetical protein
VRHTESADVVIVAAPAIETARLLLLYDIVDRSGQLRPEFSLFPAETAC